MSQPQNRSLSVALGRLRFAVVTACWIISLCLVTQILVWSLTSFTELRYAGGDELTDAEGPLIVKGDEKKSRRVASSGGKREGSWRPDDGEEEKEERPVGHFDRVFAIAVNVSRTMGLMSALVICPLLSLGVLLAVPAGAPKVERAVNALTWSIVLVLLAMPLGGWFGLSWAQGTLSSYAQMMTEVGTAQAEGFAPVFYARFLLLPIASAVGFVLVGFQFNSAVEAVLLKGDPAFDPQLEQEASNVAATSLHGTGRTAGALTKALEDTKAARQARKKRKQSASMTRVSQGEMPKRLI